MKRKGTIQIDRMVFLYLIFCEIFNTLFVRSNRSMTIERTLTIQNKLGLHARPASAFVQLASGYQSDIQLVKDGFEVNGKSILSVLMLAAEKGSKITIRVTGADQKDAIDVLSGFLEGKMDDIE